MADERNRAVNIGDVSLSREEAIDRALRVNVSNISSDQYPGLDSIKELVLHEGRDVTKVVKCLDIRSTSTGKYKFSKLTFVTLRKRKTRRPGWELETHRSITLGDENNPKVVDLLIEFLSSVKSQDARSDFYILDSEGIDLEKLDEALAIVSASGQQSEFLSRIFKWTFEDPQAQSRLTQLSSDDLLRSQSLFAVINFVRYSKALARFKEMVKENLPERDYQEFLQEHYWLFGSEYSELIDKRTLVLGQQLDFPLRRTVDEYLEVIEIKTPLSGASGFLRDGSHNSFYPGREIYKNTSQILNYLSALEAQRHRVLLEDKIDVTRVRGKLVIGRDRSEEEMRARRLFNNNSLSVEVISFDGLIKLGQRVLDIMVAANPSLEKIHSPGEAIS